MRVSKWLRFKRRLDESFNGTLRQQLSKKMGLLGNISMALTIISIPVLIFEEIHFKETIQQETFYDWTSSIHFLFLVEYLLRIISNSKPVRYIFSFSGLVDFAAFAPLFVPPILMLVRGTRLVSLEFIILNITILRLVRLLKLWRPLIFTLMRYRVFRNLVADIRLNQVVRKIFLKHLQITVLFSSGIILIGIGTIYLVELGHSSELRSFWDVVWWTALSLVGAGDGTVVETLTGRFVMLMVIIGGVIFFGSIAGTVTTIIQDKIHTLRVGGGKITAVDTIVFCGISPDLSRIFHFIQENFRNYLATPPELILINETISPEYFDLGNISFVAGSATLPPILERAAIHTARNIYIPVEVYNDPLRQDSMVLQKFMAVIATLLGNKLPQEKQEQLWGELLDRPPVSITLEFLGIEHRAQPVVLLNTYFDGLKNCPDNLKKQLQQHIRLETIILPNFTGILIAQSLRVYLSTRVFEQLMQLSNLSHPEGTVSIFPLFKQQFDIQEQLLSWIGFEKQERSFLLNENQILDLHFYLFHQGLNLIAVYHNFYAEDSSITNHTYNIRPLYAGAGLINFDPKQDVFIVLARNQFEVTFSEEIIINHLATPWKKTVQFPDSRLARLKKNPIIPQNDVIINILLGFNQETIPMLERLALDKFRDFTYLFYHPNYHDKSLQAARPFLENYGVILYPDYTSILANDWDNIQPLGCFQNTDSDITYRIQIIICNLPNNQELTDEDSDSLASQLAFQSPTFVYNLLQKAGVQSTRQRLKLHVVIETYNKSREVVISGFIKRTLSEYQDRMEVRFDFYNRIDFFSRLKAFVIQQPGLSNVLRKIMINKPEEAKQGLNLYIVPYSVELIHEKNPDVVYANLMQQNIIPVGFVRDYGSLETEPTPIFFESYQPNSEVSYKSSWVDFVAKQPCDNCRLIILTWSFLNSKIHLNLPNSA